MKITDAEIEDLTDLILNEVHCDVEIYGGEQYSAYPYLTDGTYEKIKQFLTARDYYDLTDPELEELERTVQMEIKQQNG